MMRSVICLLREPFGEPPIFGNMALGRLLLMPRGYAPRQESLQAIS